MTIFPIFRDFEWKNSKRFGRLHVKSLELWELGVKRISQFRTEVNLDFEKFLVKFTYVHFKHDCTLIKMFFSRTSFKEKKNLLQKSKNQLLQFHVKLRKFDGKKVDQTLRLTLEEKNEMNFQFLCVFFAKLNNTILLSSQCKKVRTN